VDRNADQIHYLQGPNLNVIDRRTRRIVATADYSDLPCPPTAPPYDRRFSDWIPLPSHTGLPERGQILAIYCQTLVVINARTLSVIRPLLTATPEEVVEGMSASSDGKLVVAMVGRPVPNAPVETRRAVFFDTATWEKVEEWPLDRWISQLSANGSLAVIPIFVPSGTQDGTCGFQVREVSSGKIAYEWLEKYRRKYDPCPDFVGLVPGSEGLVVAYVDRSYVLWDLVKGAKVREFAADNYLSLLPIVSPDGRLLISTFDNDPEDGEYKQDFIIWEIPSGRLLYESPRRRWTIFEKIAWMWKDFSVVLHGISDDGRFMLVERGETSLHIYEIVPSAAKE